MSEASGETIIDRDRFERQMGTVAAQLRDLTIHKLVVAAIGGMPTTEIAPELGLTPKDIGVVASYKGPGGHYEMGSIVKFVEENGPGCLADQDVGVGDEGANSGGLLPKIAAEVREHGGNPLTYAFIARKIAPSKMPNVYGETCPGIPAKPYWEFGQREPGVAEVLERASRLDVPLKAMLALGSLTAAAETAKALGINGRYVGGLPYDEHGGVVTSWLELGDCDSRNVMVLGTPDIDLDHAAYMVTQANGTPYIFRFS